MNQNYIYLNNRRINITKDSGRICWRYKTDPWMPIPHTGIYAGVDDYGTGYVIHNHYSHNNGKPDITTFSKFAAGEPVKWKKSKCQNTRMEVLQKGLNQVHNARPYRYLSYNCQTMTNIACHNESKSDTVEAVFFGLGVLAIGAALAAITR